MTRSIKIIDTQFHVEAGYNGGHMSREQYDAFYKELKEMFTEKGFRYEERENGCPDVVLGKTCLYCHPTCLSGPVEEIHFPVLEQILSSGKTFRFYLLDKHNELQDFTPDEELEYYRTFTVSVENDLLVAFKTKRSNLFKLKSEILELEAQKIHIPTIRTPYLSGYVSISIRFVNEVYKDLVQKGLLIESSKVTGIQTILLCRAANQKELRLLEVQK
mgnify:CR=1 FL=1